MYENENELDDGNLGASFNIKTLGTAIKNLGKAALVPVKALKKPGDILNAKKMIHSGLAIGRAAENVVVAINPLDTTLKKFDSKGIKAGGVGKILGKVGEKARTKPIATTAIVYGLATMLASSGTTATTTTATEGGAGEGAIVAGEGAGGGGLLTGSGGGGFTSYLTGASGVMKAAGAVKGNKPKGSDGGETPPPPMEAGFFTTKNIILLSMLGGLSVLGYMQFSKGRVR